MKSMNPTNIIQENEVIPVFIFEYLAQKNMSLLIDQALERTCSFAYTETDGLGMIHMVLEMFRLRKFMDKNQAIDMYTSFLKRKRGKNIGPKGIDFVKNNDYIRIKSIFEQ